MDAPLLIYDKTVVSLWGIAGDLMKYHNREFYFYAGIYGILGEMGWSFTIRNRFNVYIGTEQ